MTDTRKEFEEAMRFSEEFRDGNIYQFSFMTAAWKSWQACQSINDKRIQQLLAVIAKKDEALNAAQKHHKTTSLPLAIENYGSEDAAKEAGRVTWLTLVPDALAINPENVELLESK